ncbi:GumC family protein [Thioclava atlantica]|uniref:Polysaccharide chain length determinant protein n=1 Tax=Thioclava atlantica TaxID=1317124 RepID=A0A085TUK3_9RHOB|nr:Wzz/FepE/Etk N-terminal domain-containing protein [Thioclava atlantica]KFE34400.1 polysaccharide chain length determinant protein [Thioclava atlantica]
MRDLRFYAALLGRRLHWLILLTLLGTMAGLIIARAITPIYRADALIVVEGDRIPNQLASSTVRTETRAKLQVIRKRVLARESLLDIARRMELYPLLVTESGARDPDAIFAAMTNDITISIDGAAGTGGDTKDATFLNISYRAGDPTLAARVANELVTHVLKEDSDIRTRTARDTLDFFAREVERLSMELSKASAAILRFKEDHASALPERLPLLRDQLNALEAGKAERAAAIDAVKNEQERLVRRREASGATVDLDAIYPPKARERARLEAQRDALKLVLPEEDPRLASLGAQIASLDAEADAGATASPLGSAFDQKLREYQNELFAAQAREEAAQAQITQLRDAIAQVPANAASLEALQRDYDNLSEQYDRAAKSRSLAETGDTIESLAKGEKLTVIDQAVAPLEPIKPNRKTITLAGLGAGFVLGLMLIAGREFLNPGIRRPEDLSLRLGISAFATLPYISTPADVARRRRKILISSGMILAALLAVVTLFGMLYMPLDLLF